MTAVLVGQKDRLTSVAAENHMIESTGEMDARFACHVAQLILSTCQPPSLTF